MKNFALVLLGLSLFTTAASAKTLVISDIDDTIRKSNVLNKADAALKLLGTPDPFSDLRLVYLALEKQAKAEGYTLPIAYISASLPFLYDAEEWVREMKLPPGYVRQRQSLSEEKDDFKKGAIADFLKANFEPGDTVLLFGDNAELDPTIYLAVLADHGIEKNAAIFIHDVQVEATPYIVHRTATKLAGIHYYLTPLDFLLHPALNKVAAGIAEEMIALVESQEDIPLYVLDRVSGQIKVCPSEKPVVKHECDIKVRNKAREWLRQRMSTMITRIRTTFSLR
jgi:hypothetical protein